MRDKGLDVARGLAIVFMIANHILHYWVSPGPAWREFLLLISVSWAAPLFLFVSGSVMTARSGAGFMRVFKRAGFLFFCGLAVNALFYPGEPTWTPRILQSLAIAAVVIYFYRRSKFFGLVCEVAMVLSPWALPWLQILSARFPLAVCFLGEWSVYPWVGLVLLGYQFSALQFRVRPWLPWLGVSWMLFGFWSLGQGVGLNGYYYPVPVAWLWVVGSVLMFRGVSDYLVSPSRAFLGQFCGSALGLLGRRALILYFLQFMIVKWIPIQIHNFGVFVFVCAAVVCWLYVFAWMLGRRSEPATARATEEDGGAVAGGLVSG